MWVDSQDNKIQYRQAGRHVSYRNFIALFRDSVLVGEYPRFVSPSDWRKDISELELAAVSQAECFSKDISQVWQNSRINSFTADVLRQGVARVFNGHTFSSLARKTPQTGVVVKSVTKAVGMGCHVWSACSSFAEPVRDDIYWAQAMFTLANEYEIDKMPSDNIFIICPDNAKSKDILDLSIKKLEKSIDDGKISEDTMCSFFNLAEQNGGPYLDKSIFRQYRKTGDGDIGFHQIERELPVMRSDGDSSSVVETNNNGRRLPTFYYPDEDTDVRDCDYQDWPEIDI